MACIWECTSFLGTVNTGCQNVNHVDVFTTVPIPGNDPVRDTCLCKQSLLSSMHDCALCQFKNNIVPTDVTWDYINVCNRTYPERRLFLSGAVGAPTASKSGILLVAMLAVTLFSGSFFG
ncbi:hypothetical protein BKA57DRAFT_434715 [Linnemannia elongata]|nr:hypothetical protein BGZ88_010773 [Linnemannia elongata]KAF9330998.1 hypothetical protein BGZ91_012291 [Linnemannia elongata]KAG0075999.1 hypothetical protein BGZ90_009249 [Linnemannia elongata]KAH7055111.1 hypothetical protein BKA57DRAFT_434715 [Linnemannia elongata]